MDLHAALALGGIAVLSFLLSFVGAALGEEAPQRRPSPGVVIEEPQAPARPRPAPATQDLGGDKIDG